MHRLWKSHLDLLITGSTCCAGSHDTPGGYARECNDNDCGYFLFVEDSNTAVAQSDTDPCLRQPADGPSRNHLISQLVRAHVICLVYSIAEPSTFERVAEYWLPLFRREGVNVSPFWDGSSWECC